jgi:Flp pilus assembly pilin Flp
MHQSQACREEEWKMNNSQGRHDSPLKLHPRSVFATLGLLFKDDRGQDIAEYAVMLAVILVIVVGTIRLIGSNANNVFSNVASSIQ